MGGIVVPQDYFKRKLARVKKLCFFFSLFFFLLGFFIKEALQWVD
jgi:hypothetical protein